MEPWGVQHQLLTPLTSQSLAEMSKVVGEVVTEMYSPKHIIYFRSSQENISFSIISLRLARSRGTWSNSMPSEFWKHKRKMRYYVNEWHKWGIRMPLRTWWVCDPWTRSAEPARWLLCWSGRHHDSASTIPPVAFPWELTAKKRPKLSLQIVGLAKDGDIYPLSLPHSFYSS